MNTSTNNNNTNSTNSTTRAVRRRRTHDHSRPAMAAVALTAGCLVVAATGCSASLRFDYSTFHSALERGASCSELFDQRERFSDPETLAKVDDDLAGIGCTSRDATRNDR